MTTELTSRFWSKVDRSSIDGCWVWTAGVSEAGYGRFMLGGKARRAHRLSYESLVGPIAEGLVLDHLCRNRACVNPAHLEPVTDAENIRRGLAGQAVTNDATCRNGIHPWPTSAEVRGDGWLGCRPCHRARTAEYGATLVSCACGSTVRRGDLARHRRTRKHRAAAGVA